MDVCDQRRRGLWVTQGSPPAFLLSVTLHPFSSWKGPGLVPEQH